MEKPVSSSSSSFSSSSSVLNPFSFPFTISPTRSLSRSTSRYDAFGAGHSSTSISAALGYSVAKSVLGKARNNCVAVIGDGAITGGMAYEAMNNANYLNARMITILNDNGQVRFLPSTSPSLLLLLFP